MSTENNSELLFDNSVKILTDLIGFKTISGEDNTALIDYCDNILKKLGATAIVSWTGTIGTSISRRMPLLSRQGIVRG